MIIYFIIFIIDFLLFKYCENKVIFVFEHYRHGARSPSDIFDDNLDLIKEQWNGIQELTNVGLRQVYLLGNFIRNRYPNLINYEKYNPKEIEVLSTMTNRTIMSARAHLNGIFNNSKINKIEEKNFNICIPYYLIDEIDKFDFNNNYLYPDNYPEEVPVHIIDYKEKLLQLEKNNICPIIKDLREKNKKREEILDFIKQFNETFGEQLLNIFNIEDNNYYMDYENVNDISIETIINKFDDRNFSFFNNQIDIDSFYNISMDFFALKTTLVYANDISRTLGYIGSSILIRKILSYMEKIIYDIESNKNGAPKLVLLASHDTAIANMEGLIDNLFDIHVLPVPYTSSYIFELVKNENSNEYTVNLIFNNESLKTIKYSDFKKKIENDSWTYEQTGKYCGFLREEDSNINKKKEKTKWIIIIMIFSVLNTILIVYIIYLLINEHFLQVREKNDN